MKRLTNVCAIASAIAAQSFEDSGVPHRILRVVYDKGTCHVVTLFISQGRMRAYDQRGTISMPKKCTMKMSPNHLGRIWHKTSHELGRVEKAEWY